MSYVAAVCGKGQEVNKVKEQLLQSNPVLEGKWSARHPLNSAFWTEFRSWIIWRFMKNQNHVDRAAFHEILKTDNVHFLA